MAPPYEYVRFGGRSALVHRVRAERALGKPLPKKAVVHHSDGSRDADGPLVICQDQKYHFLLHIRERVLRAGGDPNNQRICWSCKELRSFDQFQGGVFGRVRECRICANAWRKERSALAGRS